VGRWRSREVEKKVQVKVDIKKVEQVEMVEEVDKE